MRNFTINQGNVLDVLQTIESASVHCVVTSPPYFGLRAYGTDTQVWGGDPNCDHDWIDTSYQVMKNDNKGNHGDEKQRTSVGTMGRDSIRSCGSCGAWRGELGLEPTPDLYIEHVVSVFREVRRVMRDDALLWVNIADSYNSGGSGWRNGAGGADGKVDERAQRNRDGVSVVGLKPGDKIGIPEELVLALRADGWYWRQTNIWHKKAPMPESVYGTRWEKHRIKIEPSERAMPGMAHDVSQNGVNNPQGARDGVNFKDHSSEYADCPGCAKCEKNGGLILRRGSGRCTTAHEYVVMFSKTADYFYDTDAIAEALARPDEGLRATPAKFGGANKWHEAQKQSRLHSGNEYLGTSNGRRNKRSVWTLSPQAYPEDHFAAFPEELPEICIKASTSEYGCCADCGAPYARIIEKSASPHDGRTESRYPTGSTGSRISLARQAARERGAEYQATSTTLGWRRTCECSSTEIVPAVVLDPFTGRGTTGVVALRLGRSFVGIELKPQYVEMARKNITNDAPLFNTQQPHELHFKNRSS